MNISNFEVGGDLAVLGAAGSEASFVGFLVKAQNLKHFPPSQLFYVVVLYE